MVALLSCASPLSPRMMNMRQTFSRRSRRVEKVRKGSVLERVLTMAHFPGLPCDTAAAAACSRRAGASPARSDSFSSSTICVPSSASRFWLNLVESVASCWLRSASCFFAASSSLAPCLTNPV